MSHFSVMDHHRSAVMQKYYLPQPGQHREDVTDFLNDVTDCLSLNAMGINVLACFMFTELQIRNFGELGNTH